MRFRLEKAHRAEFDEQKEEQSLKALLGKSAVTEEPVPSSSYWPALIARTNQRLDDATSGKAISISWAARVAIPGVVAILFFFIGLHYYVPEPPSQVSSLATVLLSLPAETQDSLLLEPSRIHESFSRADFYEDVFELSNDQITDYFIASGSTGMLLETMTDQEVNDLLATLTTSKE